MKRLVLAIAVAMLSGCTPISNDSSSPITETSEKQVVSTDIEYKGGDGSAIDNAVIIKAPDTYAGLNAEDAWIRKNHPDWEISGQALLFGDDDKSYDKIDYTAPKGETKTIYFDITDFFGK